MSYLVLKLKKKLRYRMNLDILIPDKIMKKKIPAIKSLKIVYGKEKKKFQTFFLFPEN